MKRLEKWLRNIRETIVGDIEKKKTVDVFVDNTHFRFVFGANKSQNNLLLHNISNKTQRSLEQAKKDDFEHLEKNSKLIIQKLKEKMG